MKRGWTLDPMHSKHLIDAIAEWQRRQSCNRDGSNEMDGSISWESVATVLRERLRADGHRGRMDWDALDCRKHWRFLAYGELPQFSTITAEADDSDEEEFFLYPFQAIQSYQVQSSSSTTSNSSKSSSSSNSSSNSSSSSSSSSNSSSSGSNSLCTDDEQGDLFYSSVGGEELNMNTTFQQLGLSNGDRILLDSRARRAKLEHISQRRMLKQVHRFVPANDDPDDASSTLQLLCTTRLLDANGEPFRPVRVIVHCTHSCSYLMEDLHTLWSKTALKFRCGRVVLSSDKSYLEMGIEDNAEIIITGGRG
jgi:hypothetical protein